MTAYEKFLEKAVPLKLGTIPMVAIVHGADNLQEGKWVRICRGPGVPWQRVLVDEVREDGYFMASQ